MPGSASAAARRKRRGEAFGVAAAAGHVRAECVRLQLALGQAGIVRARGGEIERGLRLIEIVHAMRAMPASMRESIATGPRFAMVALSAAES